MKKIFIFLFIIIFIGSCYVADKVNDVTWIVYGAIVLAVSGILLSFYEDKQGRKDNPLSVERVNGALKYIVSEGYGTKDSFIANNGEFMYKFFLDKGAIHELRSFVQVEGKGEKIWEVTVRGRNWAENNGVK